MNIRRWLDRRATLAVALILLIAPMVVDIVVSDRSRLFGLVAADTFYYLQVGRNLGWHGISSYDGSHLSNGYHPLWQLIVAAGYALHLPGYDSEWALVWLTVFGLILVSLAVRSIHASFATPSADAPIIFALLPVGAYGLIVSPFWLQHSLEVLRTLNWYEGSEPVHGTLWSYVNGMETPLVLFAFAGAWHHFVRGSWTASGSTIAGLWLATLTLARLDHALVAAPLALLGAGFAESRRGAVQLWLAWLAPLACYLAINKLFFGVWMPVSGAAKSSFPLITAANWGPITEVLNQFASPHEPSLYATGRAMQMLVPSLAALIAIVVVFRFARTQRGFELSWVADDGRLGATLLATGAGVALLSTYNYLFVAMNHQGHWYTPVSALFVSVVALALARRSNRFSLHGWTRPVALAAAAALSVAFFVRLHRHPDYHERYATFYFEELPLLKQMSPRPSSSASTTASWSGLLAGRVCRRQGSVWTLKRPLRTATASWSTWR